MKLLFTLILVFASALVLAQDKIHKKDKSVIDCRSERNQVLLIAG